MWEKLFLYFAARAAELRFQFDISHITMSKIFSRFFHENDIEEEEENLIQHR